MKAKNRIEWIDLCKIITMLIVCYDHTIQSIAPEEALKNNFCWFYIFSYAAIYVVKWLFY